MNHQATAAVNKQSKHSTVEADSPPSTTAVSHDLQLEAAANTGMSDHTALSITAVQYVQYIDVPLWQRCTKPCVESVTFVMAAA